MTRSAGGYEPGEQSDEGEPELVHREGVGKTDRLQRLWTPHRMAYIKNASEDGADEGCPFCRIPTLDDADGLVLTRGHSMYAVLNLHPYNPGHLMVLPYRHIADLEDLDKTESEELTQLTRQAIQAIKRASSPHGFNVGLNLGGVAGGSLSDHLHQHVVPRWSGDANFITITGQTKVLPQLLSETWGILQEVWPDA